MIHKQDQSIGDLDTWLRLAGPKSAIQWKDGRSAKESAKAWLAAFPMIPAEITETLVSHADIDEFVEWQAEPEALVRFDSLRGEPSNLDVLLLGSDRHGPLVVAVEAKADESFGGTIGETLRRAQARLDASPNSKGVARVEALAERLLGVPATELESVADLRYQLITASAAALSEAERRGVSRAIVLVHEFITDLTTDKRHAANGKDLERFVTVLAGAPTTLHSGQMIGPFTVPRGGTPASEPALYFGKVSVGLRGG